MIRYIIKKENSEYGVLESNTYFKPGTTVTVGEEQITVVAFA